MKFENLQQPNNNPENTSKEEGGLENEKNLEKIEKALDEIDSKENEIKKLGEKYLKNNPNKDSKMFSLLENLKEKSKTFLKKLSKEIANYPEVYGNYLRDRAIIKKADRLQKLFDSCRREGYFNFDDKFIPEFKSFLNEVKKDLWGKSKYKNEAYTNIVTLCYYVAVFCNNQKQEKFNSNYSDVLVDALNTVAGTNKNFTWNPECANVLGKFDSLILNTSNYLHYKSNNENTIMGIEEIFQHNPFLLLEYKKSNDIKNKNIKILDKIIEKYPPGFMPHTVIRAFNYALNNYPENYINDPQKREYITEIFKNINKTGDLYDSYLLQKEKESISEEDIDSIIKNTIGYNGKNIENQIFLASLSLTENNLKEIYESICTVNFEKTKEEEVYSKENLKKELENLPFISFFKHKQLECSPEERLDIFDKIIDTRFRDLFMSNNESINAFCSVLANILHNYVELSENIEPELFKEKLKELVESYLLYKEEAIGPDSLHHIFLLLDQYTIFNTEEKKTLIKKSLSRLSGSCIEKIVKHKSNIAIQNVREDTIKSHEEWLGNYVPQEMMENAFYDKGDENDLRHLFYKVIYGEQEVKNKDALITKYFERNSTFIDEGEFLNLFYMQKNLDKKYLPLVCSKVSFAGNDSIVSAINEAYRTGDIDQETYEQIFKDLANNAPLKVATEMFKKVIDQNHDKAGMWDETNSFTANIIRNFNDQKSLRNTKTEVFLDMANIIERVGFENYRDYFTKELLEKSLENENTQRLLLSFYVSNNNSSGAFTEYINRSFPVESAREEFLNKFLRTENIDLQKSLLIDYLMQGDNYNIFTEFAHKNADSYIDNVLAQDNIKLYTQMFPNMNVLTEDQNKKLVDAILARGGLKFSDPIKYGEEIFGKNPLSGILKNTDNNSDDRDYFTHNLLDGMTKFPEYWENYKEQIFQNAVFTDQISSTIYENISDRNSEFLRKNPELLKQYIGKAKTKKGLDIYKVLVNISRLGDDTKLPKAESQELWKLHLTKKPLDEYSYNFYTQSMEGDKTFEITRDEFNKNIELFLNDTNKIYGIDHLPMLRFLIRQREFQNNPNILSLEPDQEKGVVNKLVLVLQDDQMFRHLKYYNPDYFKESIKNSINTFETTQLYILLENKELVEGSEQVLIEHVFDKASEKWVSFEKLCQALTGTEFVSGIRKRVNALEDNLKITYKGILLNNDMLDAIELRDMYQDIKKSTDPREQVLAVAEIFGSLVTSSESKNLTEFLESEKVNESIKQKLEDIKSFVKKYDLENKGRTIVVMQFAREFLPDRNINEVISRVADNINKHERILSRYEMPNIPEYARVSMGLEYEVTNSIAEGYKELTNRDFKEDIVRLSKAARIGNGRDAIHEIATKPTVNPYLLILEMQLLHNLEYTDFNFDRSPLYQKGARGYHLTLGGATGLNVNSNIKFLQNTIIGASWGGINAGETGMRTSGGRGVTIRSRMSNDSNNKQIFENKTNSIELRGLSIDKMEVFERTILASYYGGIAIQVMEEKIFNGDSPDLLLNLIQNKFSDDPKKEFNKENLRELILNEYIKNNKELSPIEFDIVSTYLSLLKDIDDATAYNENFIINETIGYEDEYGNYIESSEFGGEYNRKRFESVLKSIDENMSVEEYVNNCKIKYNDFFRELSTEFTDKFTMINNLYLKGSTTLGKGDNTNASAMLDVTKLSNEHIEDKNGHIYLNNSIFETLGERRNGYYNIQGASEQMITHAIQRALLKFTNNMESILNKK